MRKILFSKISVEPLWKGARITNIATVRWIKYAAWLHNGTKTRTWIYLVKWAYLVSVCGATEQCHHSSPSSFLQHSAADRRKLVSADKSNINVLLQKKKCTKVTFWRPCWGAGSNCHINAKRAASPRALMVSEHAPAIQERSQINDHTSEVGERRGFTAAHEAQGARGHWYSVYDSWSLCQFDAALSWQGLLAWHGDLLL